MLSGTGALLKTGSGAATLTGAGSAQGAVGVAAGTLSLNQAGAFDAASYVTNAGATTAVAADSSLAVASDFTQAPGAALTVALGSVQPVITAGTATLNGALNVSGFGAGAPNTASALTSSQFNVIHTTGGITGDFASVGFGGASSPVDYLTLAGAKSSDNLNYNVGFGLTWLAGPSKGNGVFTLANAADTFNADVVLANQAGPFTSGWDGTTLTKNGAGTLILSSANTYTGATLVNAGTVRAGIANAIAASGNVSVASGATFDLNSFAQQVNNLNGAGNIALGSAALTVNDNIDTHFDGVIRGAGSLTKTGSGTFTLNGANAYAGGTSIDAGALVASNGASLGSGPVANGALLRLDFANDSSFANVLSGAGALVKTGGGVAILSGAGSSQGSVSVDAGTVRFLQNGAFTTTGNYATAAGATTALSRQSTLAVGNAFVMNGTLNNVIGTAQPVIDANTATIRPGATFNMAGYSASATASASQLASSVFTEIHTAAPGNLSGTFANTRIGGTTTPVDYLTLTSAYTPQNYVVGIGLTWYGAHTTTPQNANGVFTLTGADDSFDMDAVLADESPNAATQWDGKTLTKAGAGTLQLSKANTYTGATLVNAGTLRAGAANVIAGSSQLAVAPGATFDLNAFDQQANNLTGAGSVTLNGAALTANNTADSTFDGIISGSGQLTKTGANTLTLSANNTYTGPTTISAGTLQLGAGGASGLVAGDIVDNGALVFNRSDALSYPNVISGTGSVAQSGSGTLTLTNTQTYSGTTAVNAGALVLADGARLANTPQVTVAQGATFGGYGGVGGAVVNNGVLAVADAAPGFANGPAGQFTIGGALVNNGAIRMSSPTPASTLVVAGDYTGNNGQMTMSTVLGGDNSATDRLVVHGSTVGQTAVTIANAGGAGAATTNGIQLVQVDGASNGVFTLNGRAVAGPYEYSLFKGGVSTPGDGDWYLRSATNAPSPSPSPSPSPVLRPEPGGYLGNQAAARAMFVMTLHDRAGFADPYAMPGMTGNESTAWVRTRADHTDADAASGRIGESADTAIVQAGIDLLHRAGNGQHWQAGVMAGYGSTTTDATAQNNAATARGNVNGASVGAYATWRRNVFAPDGPYVDTWFQYAHFDNTVKGSMLNGESYGSRYVAGSVEAGWAFPVARTSTGPVLIEPQAQLIYSNYGADDHTEANGTTVHSDTVNNLTTRLGVRLFHAPGSDAAPGWLPFVELNWWHDTNGNSVAFNNVVVSQDGPNNRMEVKVGAQGQFSKQWRVWGNLGYQQGNGGYRSYQGQFGARYIW
ncbi:outer membrane autotransporter [Caballeronia temeraria]|uniref:Outer membrane autotransporter n=1 Tax=Caballeronia temeraria TaxID=1777137 RepID=A0A157ZXD7_9BURK|nr:outer membrane autotransporter [Caballeronia temeraria]